MTEPLLMGVDAGGSTCRVRIESRQGNVIGEGQAGPATLRLGGVSAAKSIADATAQAFETGGIPGTAKNHLQVCVGIASSERPGSVEELKTAMGPYGFHDVVVVSDAHIACVGAHQGEDGGIIIIGTGSIGYGLVGGTVQRVGGHGFPVSDLGSGAFIGLRAAQQALAAADGLVTSTPFTSTVYNAMGGNVPKVASWLAKSHATDFATLAPLVVNDDSAEAAAILEEAAQHISRYATGLVKKGVNRIALIGGLAPTISRYLSEEAKSHIVEAKAGPIDGALLMLRQSEGTNRISIPSSTAK